MDLSPRFYKVTNFEMLTATSTDAMIANEFERRQKRIRMSISSALA